MKFRRYQVNKTVAAHVRAGHPWIFRGQLSSAAEVFADGDGVQLVDGGNQTVGFGLYAEAGAIAIRVLRAGTEPPTGAWLADIVTAALARRAPLRDETDGLRLLHGDNDGLPGVTLDQFGAHAVLQCYVRGMEPLARAAARRIAATVPLVSVYLKPATKQHGPRSQARVLRGAPPTRAEFREGPHVLNASITAGQKSGAFLDLRGARRLLRTLPLSGARVLDLFCYGGSLGAAAAEAGAITVVHADSSAEALAELSALGGETGRTTRETVALDLFEAWPDAWRGAFDLVICDPPQMTSRMDQVPKALRDYQRLYRRVAEATTTAPGARVLACCCTQRISEPAFIGAVAAGLGPEFSLVQSLPQEIDHPVAFREGRYLKVTLWQRGPAAAPSPVPATRVGG